jgi:Uncharacterized conserved protein (DUF2190)
MPRLVEGIVVRVVPPAEQAIRVVPVAGQTGPPGPSGAGGFATAATNITAGQVVALTAAGAVPADPGNLAHRWAAAAVASSSALAGDQVRLATSGRVSETAWNWLSGSPVYAGAGGNLTQVPPSNGWLRVIGHAETSTSIWIQVHQPITLI